MKLYAVSDTLNFQEVGVNIVPSVKAGTVTYAIRNIVHEASKVESSGKKVIYCNIGDPCKYDFQTPAHMVDAVLRAMKDGHNGYTPSSGIPSAREAVARHAAEQRGIGTSADRVFLTTGASEAIEIALTALLNEGENVLTPAPGYPLYNAVLNKLGAVLNPYYLDEERDWAPDVADMAAKINVKTKGIVLINPNNPTGSVYSEEVLLEILELARKHGLVVFADEIYDKLIFDKKHVSVASLCDDVPVITFNGLSKSYLVPGWRVGWMMLSNLELSSPYAATITRLLDARLCSPGPQQYAVQAALEGPQDHLAAVKEKLRARRDITYDRLNAIDGISCRKPEGAFYAMPRIDSASFADDEEFVLALLRETGVLFVNGSGFQVKPGTKYFRVVFLPQPEILEEAFDKLENFMKNVK